jgi:RNA polymerase sigma-70 factor (ECF subfamily)
MCLINEAKNGDRESLSKLLSANYSIVYGYIFKLCLNKDLTKDVTQETMFKAIKGLNNFKGEAKFSTWLVTIASNTYKNLIKKNITTIEYDEYCKICQTNDKSVADIVIKKENYDLVKKAILSLPVDKRKVFILKHYYNYSYEEIAKILGCPIGTVRSRLHYCIKKLHLILEGDINE